MIDALDAPPADSTAPRRWQFSLRSLFALTAAVAILLALWLAGLWLFVLELLIAAAVGALFYFGGRRSKDAPSLAAVIVVVAAGAGITASALFWRREELVDVMVLVGGTVAAAGGLLMAIRVRDTGARSQSIPAVWRYMYGAIAAVVLIIWGALHASHVWYDELLARYRRDIASRGLFWSWSKMSRREIGPVRLFSFWTLAITHYGKRANDEDLEMIARENVVSSLDLRGADISDEGLHHLARLTLLESLGLANTYVTDAGVSHLKHLHNLTSLDVRETHVTSRGLADLRQSLPNLTDIRHRSDRNRSDAIWP